MINFSNLYNLDLFAVGIVTAAIGILGFIVFFNKRESITNRTFFAFSLVTIVYSIINYFSYHVDSSELTLWLLRFTIFSAVWHAFYFFKLMYIFPAEDFLFPKFYKFIIKPIVAITAIVALSPLTFSGIDQLGSPGQATSPIVGIGMIFFAFTVIFLVFGGFYLLGRKISNAIGIQKKQFTFIFIGAFAMFILIFILNILLPAVFRNVKFIPITPVYIFPFIAFTAYTISKHGFLNVKLIATEIFAFMIAVVTFIEIIVSSSLQEVILRVSIFAAVLLFDVLLIRSVIQERKTREQIEILNLQLQKTMAELQKIDEVKTEFVSLASHQLRTPLTSIKGYSDMLRAGDIGGQLKPEQKDAMEKIFVSAQRMVELIDDILNI